MKRSWPAVRAALAAVVLALGPLAGCASLSNTSAPAEAPADSIKVSAFKPPAPTSNEILTAGAKYRTGDPNAPVVIVEFADYECPFCAADQPVLKKVLENYRGRVQLIFRDYPVGHPHSIELAEAARCAGEQDGFWKMHEYIFGHVGDLDAQHLGEYASNLGMDGQALASCVQSGRYRPAIATDAALAERAGVTGTPAFFVNGRMLDGMQSYDDFVRAIEEAQRSAAGGGTDSAPELGTTTGAAKRRRVPAPPRGFGRYSSFVPRAETDSFASLGARVRAT
jgi:protein-disulfide isomerase